jgi:N-acyl-D-aspartate/D-glutamate deacylase
MQQRMPATRRILAGGLLVDGTGAAPIQADLLIDGKYIAAIGDRRTMPADVPVLDVTGLVVAPGFIDSHTHDDGYLLVQRDMSPKVSQGITTVVTGNCGISLAPLVRSEVPQPLDVLGPADLFRFATFKAWMDALRESPAAVNVVPLVGHTTLRVAVMADTGLAANSQEITAMQALLTEALLAGAFGMSTGTFYPPAAQAPTEEIIEVGLPMREHGGLYATHLRDEADHIVPAMEEALEIGRALDCLVVLSHHKLAGGKNHGRSEETLALIDKAARLQPVCLDCHPYPATSTMLRLDRVRISKRTLITWSSTMSSAEGRDFADIQAELGLNDAQTLERLAPAGAIYFLMDEADVERIISHPLAMIGSDGLPFDKHPHPRQWGTFTNVLRTLVRERGVLPMEAAVHKMTGLAARHYGLHDRGLLRPGYRADLVVFNAAQVRDRATFEQPIQLSEGIASVWVNGQRVWDGRSATGALPGEVLTRGTNRHG